MGKKILIVDDEADLVDAIATRLEYEGYEVDEAANGREGLGAIIGSFMKGRAFDLILLDIRMPGMTGLEVLAAIRKFESLTKVPKDQMLPILMLTAHKESYVEAFDKGCTDFVVKPFDEADLLKKIREKLNSLH
ncbi:response regulator [bacterium]|nr:response regulator [bacterium]